MKLGDFVVKGDKIVAVGENANGIFEIDYRSGKTDLALTLENIARQHRRYGSTIKYKDKIFFCPLSENHILVYEGNGKPVKKIEIPETNFKATERMEAEKFFPYAMWNNILYLFPWRYPAIIRVDLDTYEAETITDWIKGYEPYVTDRQLTYFRKDVLVCGNKACLITWNYPVIFKFDMENRNHEYMVLDGCADGFSTMCAAGERVILSDRKGRIFKGDKKLSRIEEMKFDKAREQVIFKESFFLDGRVWFVPSKGRQLAWFSGDTNECGWTGGQNQENERLLCVKPLDSHTILMHTVSGETFTYSTNDMSIKKFQMEKAEAEKNYMENLLRDPSVMMLREGNVFSCSLRRYIDVVKKGGIKDSVPVESNECGHKILEWIKQSV